MVHVEKVDVPERPSKGAWVSVWLAFGAGIAASLAANIAHAGAGGVARAVAGWAPLALLLCSEVMTRVPAPRHKWLRRVQVVSTVIVAGVAALASYRHMKGLALEYGEDGLTASTLPLSVDGLVVVASIGLVVLSQQRREAEAAERASALARAAEQEAFLAAVAAAPVPPPVPVPPAAVPVPEPVPMPLPEPSAAEPEPAPVQDPEAVPPVPEPEPVPVPPDPEPVPKPARVPLPSLEVVVPPEPWPARRPVPPPDPDPVPPDGADENAAARKVWRDSLAAGEPLTGKALGDRFKRSERWGRNRITEARKELQAEQDAGGDVAGETDQQDARVPVGAGVE
ncbi:MULTISPECIES: DUF2637 domain-containing protein [Micromonospora]|uniref:DUF2637 domain-containing protein n=1 Tax=Micromonospora TaxID=1873 RepID=UPI001319C3D5|nr:MULTISPECIES: DUF2637 domain-containing protein [Micromonospora]NES14538.1 DUF2637 domain-containing protein [Micromonospora sp. PPF5-17B]NES39064.1 DUF2637 domain-containing protein [Micromonospora solifontis]